MYEFMYVLMYIFIILFYIFIIFINNIGVICNSDSNRNGRSDNLLYIFTYLYLILYYTKNDIEFSIIIIINI